MHQPLRSLPLSPENNMGGEMIGQNGTKNGSLNNLIQGGFEAIQPHLISKLGSAEDEK